MKKQTSLITLGLMLATPALAGGGGAPVAQPASSCMSIAQIVTSDPNFSTLATALEAAGLTETLRGGTYTVFAPTNAAFAKMPSDTLAAALNDPEMLQTILLYHVVPGKVTSQQVVGMTSGKTVQGSSFLVTVSNGKVMIDNATVTKADVVACNGIVHVIDTVLTPAIANAQDAQDMSEVPTPAESPAVTAAPVAQAAPATDTMMSAPPAADISSIPALPLSGATTMPADTAVVAPAAPATDTAATTTDTAATDTTTTTDTAATTDTSAAATDTTATTDTTAAADTAEMSTNSLYDVIVADDRFSTLRSLLSDAGLTDVLMSNDYTVFAPTNEAFAAVDADTLALIASNPDTLKQVLLYHVVSGKIMGDQLGQNAQLRSMEGSSLDLSLTGSTQMVGGATVTATVDSADNGVIYVIDKVLLPPTLQLPAPPAPAEAPAATPTTDTSAAASTTTTSTTTTTTTPAAPAAPAAVPSPAPVSPTPTATGAETLGQRLQSEPQFSTLLSLLQKAGLVDALMAADVTVFAPTNDAFAKVPKATLDMLLADDAKLKQVLTYHVVTGRVTETELQGTQLRSLEGSSLDLKANSGVVSIGVLSGDTITGSTLSATPIVVGNSVIYPIDSVLIPPTFK